MNFSIIPLRLYEVAEPAALVNGQDERRINAPPLTSAPAPACVATKRAKATSAFALKQYGFSYICPYRFISPQEIRVPFGHQSGKNSYYFDCHNLWKSLYLQGFSQFKSFLENKIKYYFLYLQRAYLRLFFSNMPAFPEIFKCWEFESH